MDYKKRLILLLTELFKKYNLEEIKDVSLEDYPKKICFRVNNKTYEFISDFSKAILPKSESKILILPIMHWRNERKYIEMKKLIEENQVHNPVGMKIKNISIDDSINNILIKELDIIEWILNDKITAVYANAFKDEHNEYYNIFISTKNSIKVSMEIGKLKNGNDILMHEIITQKGIITDQPVDTQTAHYPVYVYKDNSFPEIYNDLDFELYGLENKDIAKIRYIFAIFQNISKYDIAVRKYNRLRSIVKNIYKSKNENKKIFLKRPQI